MSERAIHRVLAEACLDAAPPDLAAIAQRHELTDDEASALSRAPSRVALYRRLVRHNLVGVISKMMPRTRARLNDVADGAFDASVDAFLEEAAPRSHYLRDVPTEFLAYATPRWATRPGIPPYAADLAAYELLHFQVAAAPPISQPDALADLALDRPVLFSSARLFRRFAHAVHDLPDDEDDRTAPPAGEVALFLYRDAENSVRVLSLTPLAASLAERLLAGDVLGAAISGACEAHRAETTPELLASTARTLADWAARGLVLGAALQGSHRA